MIKEIITSLKDASLERIKSPFLGSFAIAWVITNWKLTFTLLFSKEHIEEVIKNVAPLASNYYDTILIPAGAAIIFVLAFPWLNNGIQAIRQYAILFAKENKFETEKNILEKKDKLITAEACNNFLAENGMEDEKLKFEAKKTQQEKVELELKENKTQQVKVELDLKVKKTQQEKAELEFKMKKTQQKEVELMLKEKEVAIENAIKNERVVPVINEHIARLLGASGELADIVNTLKRVDHSTKSFMLSCDRLIVLRKRLGSYTIWLNKSLEREVLKKDETSKVKSVKGLGLKTESVMVTESVKGLGMVAESVKGLGLKKKK